MPGARRRSRSRRRRATTCAPTTSPPRRSPTSSAGCPSAPSRTPCATCAGRSRTGKLPEQPRPTIRYINVKTVQAARRWHMSEPRRASSPAAPASSAATWSICCSTGAIDVRVIDNLGGGRLENLRSTAGEPRSRSTQRDMRDARAGRPLVRGRATTCSTSRGIGDIVPSIERPVDYMRANVHGHARVLEAARHAGVEKFVYAASSSCYGIGRRAADHREARRSGPSIPTRSASTWARRRCCTGARSTGCRSNSIRIFNAYGPRSRTTGAYGAVFGVFLAQKLDGQAVHRGRRRHAAARFRVRHRRGARLPRWPPSPSARSEIYNLGAGNPQSVNRLVELLGGEVVHVPKRPGEPDCTWADIAKIQRELGWEPTVSFEEASPTMLEHIDYWRDAPVWDAAVDRGGDARPGSSILATHEATGRTAHKIKTLEELRDAIGPRPRAQERHHVPRTFDLVHPGHLRHLMYAKEKADILVASLTADAHITKANYRPFVPQELRADEPGRARDASTTSSSTQRRRRSRTSLPPARLLRQGLRVLRERRPPEDPGGDRRAGELRRRDGVHARRRRLFLVARSSRRRRPISASRSCWR